MKGSGVCQRGLQSMGLDWRRTIAHNYGCLLLDGLLGDADGEVVGEQDPRGDGARSWLDVFLQQADVVPGAVGKLLGVAVHVRYNTD